MMIAGGNWSDKLADPATQLKLPGEAQILALLAESLKTPVAILLHVPQQPIFDGKREDQIIAYTFREFLKAGDPTWPLLAPMAKSAVRAMDATQEAMKKEWGLDVTRSRSPGASKRGWTTWLTGAVDDRAVAIAPMVIDMLNMSPHTKLQKASFGGKSSEQIDDYQGLDEQIDTPRGQRSAQNRRSLGISRPAHAAQAHHARHQRPLLAAGRLQSVLERPAGRKISDLCAQQRPRLAGPGAAGRRPECAESQRHHRQAAAEAEMGI